MIQLTETTACKMRDQLRDAKYDNKITGIEITDKLCKIKMPKWLQAQIIEMAEYMKYERCTDATEQAMLNAVYFHILDEVLAKEKNVN